MTDLQFFAVWYLVALGAGFVAFALLGRRERPRRAHRAHQRRRAGL